MSSLKNVLRLAPFAMVLACSPGPIDWDDNIVALKPTGLNVPEAEPRFPNQCPPTRSVYADSLLYGAWWSLRPDSSADLVASTSRDGVHWSDPVKVDTTDAAKGCEDRMTPSLYAEGHNLTVVYSMKAKEGPGVFLSHSMDRARTFHSPVAVVYGKRLGRTALAAQGNLVVVGYEDPNTTPTRISIAVSHTMAHLFQYREVVSPPDAAALGPWVNLSGNQIEVMWHRADNLRDTIGKRGTIR